MEEIWLALALTEDAKARQCAEKANDARNRIPADEDIASWLQEPMEEQMQEWARRGAAAYARKKATFYRALAKRTSELRLKAAMTCDPLGEWASFEAEGVMTELL